MADVFASLKLGFETGDFNRFSKAIEDGVARSLGKVGGAISKVGQGPLATGAAVGLGLQLGNKFLSNISRSVTDFPMVVAIMKLIRLILMIGLLPLIPLLTPVVGWLADFAAWMLDNPIAMKIAAVLEVLGFMWAWMKAGEFIKGLAGLGGGVVAGAGAGAEGGIIAGVLSAIGGVPGLIMIAVAALTAYGIKKIVDALVASMGGGFEKVLPLSNEDIAKASNTQIGMAGGTIEMGTDIYGNHFAIVRDISTEIAKNLKPQVRGLGETVSETTDYFDFYQHGLESGTATLEKFNTAGLKAVDVWKVVMKDVTTQWTTMQKTIQAMFGISGGTGNAATDRANHIYSGINYGSGAMGAAIAGSITGYAGAAQATAGNYGSGASGPQKGRYHDASLLITPSGVKEFDSGDTIMASKGGMGGGSTTININIDQPSVRNDTDLKELVRLISREIQPRFRGYVSYGPRG